MNEADPSPINLDELRLLPDWLREEGPPPSKQYASHEGARAEDYEGRRAPGPADSTASVPATGPPVAAHAPAANGVTTADDARADPVRDARATAAVAARCATSAVPSP